MSDAVQVGGETRRKPLVRGRGLLLLEDFCRSTGLDHETVEPLMRTELFESLAWGDEALTGPVGIFDDALPSRPALVALGLPVRDDYDPVALRSCEADDEDDGPAVEHDDDAGPTYRMTW